MWEYLIVEEGNPISLQGRLVRSAREGWEAVGLACVTESRLLALLKRRIAVTGDGRVRDTPDPAR
jgi:hypothetical protein